MRSEQFQAAVGNDLGTTVGGGKEYGFAVLERGSVHAAFAFEADEDKEIAAGVEFLHERLGEIEQASGEMPALHELHRLVRLRLVMGTVVGMDGIVDGIFRLLNVEFARLAMCILPSEVTG